MILVTGAAGFLGRFVCAQLRHDDRPYVGIDQCDQGAMAADWLKCDITNPEELAGAFRSRLVTAVIHLAAVLPSASRKDPHRATEVNVTAGANLLAAAARFGVEHFVLASSMSVYGFPGTGTPVSEREPAAPADLYGAAKRYLEIYGEALSRAGGFRFTSLRIAGVVGPGARHTASPWRSEIFEKLAGGVREQIAIPFREDTVLSLVHAADVARMLTLLAVRQGVPAAIYNTPAENWRMGDLKRLIEALDPNLTVELGCADQSAAPPVADGATFLSTFDWCARPLTEQLTETVRLARPQGQ